MKRSMACAALVLLIPVSAAGLIACGSSEDLGGAPDVRGLTLPAAEEKLEQAGYSASVKNDALFGVIVPSHFTVCSEHSPKGKLVPLDVSKEC